MRNPEKVLNTLCLHSKVSDYKYERLYRILFNEEMFYVAYQRIYAKQGNMTSGADGKTIDQMSIQRIELINPNQQRGYIFQKRMAETVHWEYHLLRIS